MKLQTGFTIIELMVSLVLGLLVVGAAGSLFLSNRKVYGSTEAVNRIQENQRTAFELMARDIREAGGNPCTKNIVNMLDTSKPAGSYFTAWADGISGTEGGSNPDTITLSMANGSSIAVTGNAGPSANIEVSSTAGLATNDILMVCNAEVASIFQATALPNGVAIQHNSGTGNPGNLQKPFQADQAAFDNSSSSNSNGYCFFPDKTNPNPNCLNTEPSNSPAQVVKPYAAKWYIANNPRGSKSLYRQIINNGGLSPQTPSEIAEGVTDMQVTYKVGTGTGSFSEAAAGLQWKQVTAVNVVLTLQAVSGGGITSNDAKGTNNAVLTRTLSDVVTLRNHVDVQ